jgi:uncharacterized protein YndB with AHSA1/START domain
MRIEKSVEIAAPPEKIWPFLVEPEKIMQWFTLLKKFEYTGAQRSGVGTPFYYEESNGPMLMKLSYEVTEWVENERLAFGMTSGPATTKRDNQVWAIEATPSGSRFTCTEEFEMSWGVIGRMLVALMVGMVGKRIQEMLDNLKHVVEAQE